MHLRDECVKAHKILFVADFFDECASQTFAIHVCCKIEEEDFQLMVVIDRDHRIGTKIGDPVQDRSVLDSLDRKSVV